MKNPTADEPLLKKFNVTFARFNSNWCSITTKASTVLTSGPGPKIIHADRFEIIGAGSVVFFGPGSMHPLAFFTNVESVELVP